MYFALVEVWKSGTPKNWSVASKTWCQEVSDFQFYQDLTFLKWI